LWEVATGKQVLRFVGHEGKVDEVAFGPRGVVLTGSVDRTLRLWLAPN